MIGKCRQCSGRVVSQTNLFYSDVVMRVCADCSYVQSAYKRANTVRRRRGGTARLIAQFHNRHAPNAN